MVAANQGKFKQAGCLQKGTKTYGYINIITIMIIIILDYRLCDIQFHL